MIIRGEIATIQGPKPVSEIKVGDIIINGGHCPFPVKKIETVQVKKGITFANNPNLIVAEHTKLITVYGKLDAMVGESVVMRGLNDVETPDLLKETEGGIAYHIQLDGTSIWAEGYKMEG